MQLRGTAREPTSFIADVPMFELDGYRIEEVLSAGPRFDLIRATSQLDDATVLLEVPSSAVPSRRDIVALRHEYQILGRLQGPGIPTPIELTEHGGHSCLILADPGGRTLRAWAAEHTGDVASVCRVAAAVARVLSAVHEHGIIHKDLTPEHILVGDEASDVHLIGFGVAAVTRERGSARAAGHLEGTLAYMSPEQTGRMNRTLDSRGDLYSLGVVLYELLAGRLPFATTDALALVHAHVARAPEPLHGVNPHVPLAVSAVVARLLAKPAEERYQSAYGLRRDLEELAHRLEAGTQRDDFTPGLHDASDRLQIPEKLYAREAEVGALLDAYARVAAGGSEVVLVSGYAGIGKSALIGEVNRPITASRGWFISGKFDQFRRGTPYSAVLQAFRDLIRKLLGEPSDALDRWRSRLQDALGPNGRVLLDVIPELERIVGPQPAVPELGLSEARARFQQVFRSFVRALAGGEHPLVIFIDDLQWSDAATLDLLELILLDADIGHVLVLGAFRDAEVTRGDPLTALITNLREAGTRIQTMHVEHLPADAVVEMLSDTFRMPPSVCVPLAEIVLAKTGGNPFFVYEFLRALHENGHIVFDAALARWTWKLERIRGLAITDNVVDLVAGRIRVIAPESREVVELASCIGAEFDLGTLAAVLAIPPASVAARVQEPLRLELIQPLDESYKYALATSGGAQSVDEAGAVRFRFIHDRVQQAAHALIAPARRAQVHLRIGRLLLERAGAAELDERVFDIVDHLDAAHSLIDTEADRVQLAELNLRAGRRAKMSMAYRPALTYLRAGLGLLGDDPWNGHYETALALHGEVAEAAYLASDFAAMEAAGEAILARAHAALDTVRVYELRIARFNSEIRYPEAVAAGLEILTRIGEPLPEKPGTIRVLVGLVDTMLRLRGRATSELLQLREMTDARQLAVLRVLMGIASATYYVNANLFPLLVFRMVRLSVRYGNAPLSAFAYACYGLILCGVVNIVDRGYGFGRLAMDLIDRFGARELEAKIAHLTNLFIRHWREELRDTLPPLLSGARAGVETGDYEYASYCRLFHACHLLFSGHPVDGLVPVLRDHYDAAVGIRQDKVGGLLLLVCSAVRRLSTVPGEAPPQQLPAGDIAPFLARWEEVQDRVSLSYAHFFEAMIASFLGHPARVLEEAERVRPYEDNLKGQPFLPRLRVYESLALLDSMPSMRPDDARRARRRVASNLRQLRRWARWAPANYAHFFWLTEAERQRQAGRHGRALEAFQKSIAHASGSAHLGDEAMAWERAGRHHLDCGNGQTASMYLARAAHVYERWGARHKAALLREEFRELLAAAEVASPADRTAGPDGLDLLSVVRSARALSEEIDLPRLLSRVLDLTLQTAGARRGFLIVPAGEELMIAAAVDPDGDAPLPEPVSTSRRLARTVVNYVARSHEDMVLADASRDPRLQDDPWVRENRPRSLLCVPIRGRSQLLGLLYLDNDLSPGVFTPDRLQVVRILGAQAAISMENARLYEGLTREVETRTSELEIATRLAASERDNVDRLLRNILPGTVADELKSQGRVQPVRYDQASILFCDFVEFTRWASRIEPEALISELDRVFLAFDDICARNHLEKIKTIGDAYMCAGGLPIRRRTHAVDTCLAALEMRALIERENTIPGGVPWRVRLGVHSGPVMAGVIGKSRFAYDVWGDAVNVASRLEATSEPGRINVSRDTACMVEPFFTLTPRGPADIRNRGEMEMFFLEEIRPELASNDNAFRARYTQMLRTPTT